MYKKKEKTIVLNLERPDTIDGVAFDKANLKLILLLADGMDWHDETKHLLLLQEKLNHYITYIDSKQYLERYPDVATIEIRINFLFKETDNCKLFLEYATKTIAAMLQNAEVTIAYGTQETFPNTNS